MAKRIFPSVLFVSLFLQAFSQAGTGVYRFLDLPVSSRLAALGGTNISLRDNDLNFAFQNPALLTAETHNTIGLNMANYLDDIQFGSAMYGRTIKGNNYMAVGVQYIDYGLFDRRDETNTDLGEFTAKDVAVNIVYARLLTERITVGATLKPIFSVYERYTSYGAAMDVGVNYNNPDELFSAGLVFRNMGTQFKGYYSDEEGQHFEPLAFDIQLGLSKKFSHAPLRFSFTLHNLQQWNLNYQSTNQPKSLSLTGSITEPTNSSDIHFVDMAFRHAIIGVEFVPTRSFYLAASYNHRRHTELNMPGFKSMAGFSFGGGIKLYKFQVGFGMSEFQVGNYSYQFSISTSLNEFRL
ncbi:MAG TPA: type IX secretion system protein PorQ [Paludibacter sp.]|nr:type IX secretion system protein PorQ [Paludibacter sp.]